MTFSISTDSRKEESNNKTTSLRMIQVSMDGEIFSEKYDLWPHSGVRPYFTLECNKGFKRPLGLLSGPP